MAPQIAVKRAYEAPAKEDGHRVLVDRMWPRGVKKEALNVQEWMKEVAPTSELRQWFNHDPERWEEFQRRYSAELDNNCDVWAALAEAARHGKLTLVYGAIDELHNNAVALRAYLLGRLKPQAQQGRGSAAEAHRGQ
ncbi:hypothetical protein ABPG77_008737 [Micractinium sp. CCAP 211/92]